MTPAQCRAARMLLGWKQSDLSEKSRLKSLMPVSYFEKYGDAMYETPMGPRRHVSPKTTEKIKLALEKAGIEFIGDTGINLRKEVK